MYSYYNSFDLGCSGDLKYVLTSRECVESCPCGTYQLFGSCQTSKSINYCNYNMYINNNIIWNIMLFYLAVHTVHVVNKKMYVDWISLFLGSAISFDSLLNTVHVLPTTKPGSIVANLTLLIDEAALNASYFLIISKYIGGVYHNDSGWVNPHYSNNIDPLFELISSTPDVVVSEDGNIYRLIFKNSAIQHLRMASPVKCVTDSTRYVAVSFGLHLLSDSLYHLGDHIIMIQVSLQTKTNSYIFQQNVRLTVEAGMIKASCLKKNNA